MSESDRDPIGELMRIADNTATPDPSRMERAMKRVHGEWRAAVVKQRRGRWQRWVGAVAAVVAIVTIGAILWSDRAVQVATVERAVGEASMRDMKTRLQPNVFALPYTRTLMSGQQVTTGETGRVLLKLPSGEQLRIDTSSQVYWVSPTRMKLAYGTIYIETHNETELSDSDAFLVVTPFGSVRHVGTRFEVQVTEGSERIRVRDGAVVFSRSGQRPLTVSAGQELSADESTSRVHPGPGSADPQWEWTRQIAPELLIEGRSLFDVLEALTHESGLHVFYADDAVREQAKRITLRGSIEGLDTPDALRAVLAGSDLRFEVNTDRIDIQAGSAK